MKKIIRVKNRSTIAFEDIFRKRLLSEFYRINKRIAEQLAIDGKMPKSYKNDSVSEVLRIMEQLDNIEYEAIFMDTALDVRKKLWKPFKDKKITVIELTASEKRFIRSWAKSGSLAVSAEASETKGKLYRIVSNAYEFGQSQKDTAAELAKEFSITQNKSTFWARDMLGTLNGQLSVERDKALGIKKQIWRTTGDGAVRSSHAHVDGEIFDVDKGIKIEGRWLLPGEDYNCRCYGESVFEYEDE